MNLLNAEPDKYFFILAKGEPGTGKSDFAASFPEPYFFDFDRKIESLKARWPNKSIEYDQFDTYNDAADKLEKFMNRCDYGTLIDDSITFQVDAITQQTFKVRGTKGKTIGNIKVKDWDDYNAEESALTNFLNAMASFRKKCHSVVLAHVIHGSRDSDSTGLVSSGRRILTGGKTIGSKIPGFFPNVFHFQTELGDINEV